MKYNESIVKYLDYLDTSVPYVINFYILLKVTSKFKKNVDQIEVTDLSTVDLDLLTYMLYEGIQLAYIIKKDTSFNYTIEDVSNIVSICLSDYLIGLRAFFQGLVMDEVKAVRKIEETNQVT